MASNWKLAAALKNAKLNQYDTEISTSGLLRIYSGTQPTNPDTALSGNTMLASLALSSTAFAAASAGVITANSITTEASADNTGTATFFSLLTSGATRMADGSVGTSSADLNLNTTSITAGAAVSVSSLTVTSGN
jgi:hypothetical protein